MAGFFTQMICGGTAFICTRLAEASEDEKIIYLDANNLYGWAMSQKLPYNGFRWMSQTELLELKASPKEFFERLRKGGKMCAVMGDFTVPTGTHKKTWDYPLIAREGIHPRRPTVTKTGRTECEQQDQAQLTSTVPPPDHVGQAPLLCVW